MRKLRVIRIAIATFFMLAVTACFLDFSGTSARWLGWTAKVQLVPAALALSAAAVVVVALTLVCGRVYCSMFCPLGILQDIAIFFRRKPWPGGRGAFPRAVAAVRGAVAAAFFAFSAAAASSAAIISARISFAFSSPLFAASEASASSLRPFL